MVLEQELVKSFRGNVINFCLLLLTCFLRLFFFQTEWYNDVNGFVSLVNG